MQTQIRELEYAVFRKNQRLNVFEEMDTKIADNERQRAENESKIWQTLEGIQKERDEYLFELRNLQKQTQSLEEHKSLIYQELRRQADSYEQTKEDFILKLKENYTNLLKPIEELKKQMGAQEMTLNLTSSKTMSNSNYIKELQSRSDQFATNIQKCQKELTLLYELKQDKSIMEEMKEKMWTEIMKMQKELDEKTNQFNTVENFVEKYIPIRIQSQISETLACVLTRSQLNKLENFEMEKFQVLNSVILEDDGGADLKVLMREILKEVIREQEEEKNNLIKKGGMKRSDHARNASLGANSSAASINLDKKSEGTKRENSIDHHSSSITHSKDRLLKDQTLQNQQQHNMSISDGNQQPPSMSDQVQNQLRSIQQPMATHMTEDQYFDQLELEKNQREKKEMFELLVQLDMTEEISIKRLLDIPYKVTGEDEELQLTQINLIKIVKL